jgi:dynein heavy chain
MNEIRKEAEEREYLLQRALKDKDKLRNFIRLIDYICVETFYNTNFESMKILLDEMNKDRKQGLFTTTVMFDNEKMIYTPDEKEITDQLLNLLEEMINTIKNIGRVINSMDNYVKLINKDNIIKLDKII